MANSCLHTKPRYMRFTCSMMAAEAMVVPFALQDTGLKESKGRSVSARRTHFNHRAL